MKPPAILYSLLSALAASPGFAETIVRGPYLQRLLSDSVTITWRTDAPTTGRVTLLPEGRPDLERVIDESVDTTDHAVTISELAPDTVHLYRIDGRDEEFRFRTAPPTGRGAVRVAVIGDSGNIGPGTNQAGVRDVIAALSPDLLLHVGDLVYAGNVDTVVFQVYRDIIAGAGFYTTRGDHNMIPLEEWWPMFPPPDPDPPPRPDCTEPIVDCAGPPPEPDFLGDEFPRRTAAFYGFDWGPAHFTVLDINRDMSPCTAQQLQFACADLGAARRRGVSWLILVVHDPPMTRGLHCGQWKVGRALIPRLADTFGVDLVLSGDDHNFQRTFPLRGNVARDREQDPYFVDPGATVYVVSGGGGTTLYGECTPGAINCDERCREDFSLIPVFAMCHHAVELEISPLRLTLRAHAASGEGCDAGVIDEFTIQRPIAFLRGDVDRSGSVNINDPIAILNYLFRGSPLECAEAAGDAQDDGRLNIIDPSYLLGFLFLGRAPPPAPFPDCESFPARAPGCNRSECGE